MHHEIGLAEDILRKVLRLAGSKGIKKISRASISVGEFYLARPEQIAHSFQMVSRGTPAEGAKLNITISPLKARCSSCKKEFELSSQKCPSCGGVGIEIVSGKELLVERVE
jgi:hydrogenase nickel incorporation protein HypA/HybF